jgi:hypothetical protein
MNDINNNKLVIFKFCGFVCDCDCNCDGDFIIILLYLHDNRSLYFLYNIFRGVVFT